MGLEDRLRKLERRLKPKPEPDAAVLEHTRWLADEIVRVRLEHAEEIERAAEMRELMHGEAPRVARTVALYRVLERYPDGRVVLDALADFPWVREAREKLRKERA